ncbi:MAG: hypothetical protein OD918_11425, partial [Gammaproteobacteria bacterium]
RLGSAGHGTAVQGLVWPGQAWHGQARMEFAVSLKPHWIFMARLGTAGRGQVWRGNARRGVVWQGKVFYNDKRHATPCAINEKSVKIPVKTP